MTYAQFLFVFLCPILTVQLIWLSLKSNGFRKNQSPLMDQDAFILGILILIVVAIVYTTPWDNYLVMTGVWSYSPDRIVGRIGYVPIEEYMFFVFQTMMTGLWCLWLAQRLKVQRQGTHSKLWRYAGVGAMALLFAVGAALLFADLRYRYFALIVVWAAPVVGFQWWVGYAELIKNKRLWILGFLIPSVYLCLADTYAIGNGVWSLSSTQTTGISLGVLPFEEALFFFSTNVMVTQGLILFVSLKDKYPWVRKYLWAK